MSKLDTLHKQLGKLLKEYKKLQKEYRRTKEWDLEKLQILDGRKTALMEALKKAKSSS